MFGRMRLKFYVGHLAEIFLATYICMTNSNDPENLNCYTNNEHDCAHTTRVGQATANIWLQFSVTDSLPCVNWRHGFHAELVRGIIMCERTWLQTTVEAWNHHVPNMLQEPQSVHPAFPLLYIFLLHSSVCSIYTHFSKKAQGTAARDGNLSDAGVRHTQRIPRGDIISAICGRLQGSCRHVSLGTLDGRVLPGTAPSRSGPARRSALQLFLKRLEFNQNMQLLCSVLFKPKVVFPYFPAHWSPPMTLRWEAREPPFFSYKEAKASKAAVRPPPPLVALKSTAKHFSAVNECNK